MFSVYFLLFSYGLAFGLMNKVPILYGKSAFLDALLGCSYCTGFHCGWMAWLCSLALNGKPPVDGGVVVIATSILLWSFSSAGACYILDAVVGWFWANTPAQE